MSGSTTAKAAVQSCASRPIGLIGSTIADPFTLAAEAGALTHGHPSGYLSGGVFASVISELVSGARFQDAIGVARDTLTRWDGHEETLSALDRAVDAAAEGAPPSAERVEYWVRVGSARRRSRSASTARSSRATFAKGCGSPSITVATATAPAPSPATCSARCTALANSLAISSTKSKHATSSWGLPTIPRAFIDNQPPDFDRYPGY